MIDMPKNMGASASRPGARATHRAAKASRPKASPPSAKEEWHLVCITRKGKVSMLKNLDLRTARETYKRLLPDTRPEKHEFCEICSKKGGGGGSWGCWISSGSDADRLERVEALGPEGMELDPWHGVEPKRFFHCDVGKPIYDRNGNWKGRVPPHSPPEPEWDASRSDFWNNPTLWAGIDPTKQLCWQRRSDEHLYSDGASDSRAQPSQRVSADLGGNKRPQGVKPQRRTRQGSARTKANTLAVAALQSERTGA